MLLAGGDKDIVINCGGMAFDVKDGQGKSSLFVVDTEQTQVLGSGTFDLEHERFDMTIAPKPKEAGLLSLRTPVRVYGTFKQPQFEIEKGPLVARAGAMAALAVVNPLAALVPLIETGPGENTNCGAIENRTAGAVQQAEGVKPGAAPKPKAKAKADLEAKGKR